MSKHKAERVIILAECLPDLFSESKSALRDYAAILREREEIAYEGKQQWDEVARILGADGDNVDAVFAAAKQVVRERESAKAGVTDELVMLARRVVFDADEQIEWTTMRAALEAVAPMLASARVPDIDAMVGQFLSWRLPEDFSPDCGISFTPEYNVEYMAKQGKPPMRHEPTGTNLFDADQARAMILHMLAAAPKRGEG